MAQHDTFFLVMLLCAAAGGGVQIQLWLVWCVSVSELGATETSKEAAAAVEAAPAQLW